MLDQVLLFHNYSQLERALVERPSQDAIYREAFERGRKHFWNRLMRHNG